MTVLGSRESGFGEGDRLRADSTGGRGASPEQGLEFGARSLPKRLRHSSGEKKSFENSQ